jgi:hypothetical protein
MHANSLEAYHAGHVALFPRRSQEILGTLTKLGHATDRQVRDDLGFPDMNAVRPRITELIEAGVLQHVADEIDPATKRTVRVVAICPRFARVSQLQLQGVS